MTLAEVPAAFVEARVAARLAARHAPGSRPRNTCRYCGRVRLADGGLDGHARCLVSVSFQRALYELWFSSPELTKADIARACGIGAMVIHRWFSHVERIGRAA